MQREIKFRAFGKVANTMNEVSNIDFDGKQVFVQEENLDVWLDFDDVILMQFTGFYDKNDKKIYEGDLLKITVEIFEEKIYIEKVVFKSGAFVLEDKECKFEYLYDTQYFEIIGNIYENSDLISERV